MNVFRYFQNKWMCRKEKWACHITQKNFTGGLIASSYAESCGSAQGRWFQQPRHTLVQVFTTCFEKEDHDIKVEQELLANVVMASTHGIPSDPPLVAQCRAKYSSFITQLVLSEVIDSKSYTAFISTTSLQSAATISNVDTTVQTTLHITVKRNICSEKERTVTVRMQGPVLQHIEGCDCPTLQNCGHICRHVFSACVLLCTQFSSRVNFSHLEHLINKRYLLRKEVQFLGRSHSESVSLFNSTAALNVAPHLEDHGVAECDAEECATEHFASQITSPSQNQKGGRLSNITFDKLRAECTPICQVGSRNNKVGHALMDMFKTLHSAILAMSPEEQNSCTAASLLHHCQAQMQSGAGLSSLPLMIQPTVQAQPTANTTIVPSHSASLLASVAADHRGKLIVCDTLNFPPTIHV